MIHNSNLVFIKFFFLALIQLRRAVFTNFSVSVQRNLRPPPPMRSNVFSNRSPVSFRQHNNRPATPNARDG
jgi:hypothetical protein